jgi:hypothetical protein
VKRITTDKENERMNAIIEGVENAMRFQSLYETNSILMRVDSKLTEMVAVIGEWVSVMRDSVQTLHGYGKNSREDSRDSDETTSKRRVSETNTKGIVEYVTLLPNNNKYEPSIIAANSNEKELDVTNGLLASAGETAKAVGMLTDVLRTTNSGIERFAGVVTTTGHLATGICDHEWIGPRVNRALSMHTAAATTGTTSVLTGWGSQETGAIAAQVSGYRNELDWRQIRPAASVKSQWNQYGKTGIIPERNADAISDGLTEVYERVNVVSPITIPARYMSVNPQDAISQKYIVQAYYHGKEPKLSTRDNVLHAPSIGTKTSEIEYTISGGLWHNMTPENSALISAGQTSIGGGLVEADYRGVAAKNYGHLQHTKIAEMAQLTERSTFAGHYNTSNKRENNKTDVDYLLGEGPIYRTESETRKKAIIINLNRPMIEHFTVHVGNNREGVGELKKAVEEVLLEILNSAN